MRLQKKWNENNPKIFKFWSSKTLCNSFSRELLEYHKVAGVMADEIAETDEPTVDLLGLPEEDDETPLQKKVMEMLENHHFMLDKTKKVFFFFFNVFSSP